jgi:2-C-methyl-D-erythritol 4-phosphate cytidylyltransferase
MKKYAIIAAGGSGVRMGNATPKQFIEVKGKSILSYSVRAFVSAFDDMEIIVVAPATHMAETKNICKEFSNVQFVEGGATRFQSVQNGLSKVTGDAIVFVHDAVRCLVTTGLIRRCYEEAVKHGSAVPAVEVNDSVRIIENGSSRVMDRSLLRVIQTPQTFKSDIILSAFDATEQPQFTDEASVVEASGKNVHLVEGDYTNIKITRPLDLLIAEKLIEQRSTPE